MKLIRFLFHCSRNFARPAGKTMMWFSAAKKVIPIDERIIAATNEDWKRKLSR